MISEIMWDGTEYIELFNATADLVELEGYTLTRQQAGGEAKTIVTFSSEHSLAVGAYYLIEKTEAATTVPADVLAGGLTLVNTGELVQLRDGDGTIVDTANQLGEWFAGANTTAGDAMERTDMSADGTLAESWHTSTGSLGGRTGTPGAANTVPPENSTPTAAISGPTSIATGVAVTFSAEDSSDPEGNTLTYAWTFSDGGTSTGATTTHTYSVAGTHTVILAVSDGELDAEASRTVTVTAPVYSSDVVINEFLPNPAGSDTDAEFIELKNLGSATVDLAGWQLDDADGGSAPYTIPAGTTIGAGAVRAFMRSETKLALNNTSDSARLLNPAGTVASVWTYSSAPEGQSYNRTSSTVITLSTTPTPNAANSITAPVDEDEAEAADDDDAATTTGAVAGSAIELIPLAEVREEEPGTVVRTEGVVSAPPGLLGKTVLYLSGSGIQVYFSKGEWPALKLGDKVTLTGTLSSIQGEARLKIAAATDLTRIAAGSAPVPHVVATGDIDEPLEGSLVTVQGHVTETSGDTFYVDDDSGAIKVYLKDTAAIDKPKMQKGTAVTITGIVSETTSGYRILPRFQEDVRLGLVAGLTSFPATGLTDWVRLAAHLPVRWPAAW